MFFEMPPQSLINHILENQRVINGIVLGDIGLFVPAWCTAAGDTRVHDIIRHEKEGLEPFDLPSQNGGILVLLLGEFALLEDLDSLDDGEATGHFSTGYGVGDADGVVVDELLLDIVGEGGEILNVGDDLLFDLFVHGEEGVFVGGCHACFRIDCGGTMLLMAASCCVLVSSDLLCSNPIFCHWF